MNRYNAGVLRPTFQIICDDVRIENNGKVLVIGMYLDAIIVLQQDPTVLLTFLLVFETNQSGTFHTSVQLSGPDGDIGELMKIDFDVKAPGTVAGILKVPVKFNSSGKYRLSGSVTESGEKYDKIFGVTLATPATPGEAK